MECERQLREVVGTPRASGALLLVLDRGRLRELLIAVCCAYVVTGTLGAFCTLASHLISRR